MPSNLKGVSYGIILDSSIFLGLDIFSKVGVLFSWLYAVDVELWKNILIIKQKIIINENNKNNKGFKLNLFFILQAYHDIYYINHQ